MHEPIEDRRSFVVICLGGLLVLLIKVLFVVSFFRVLFVLLNRVRVLAFLRVVRWIAARRLYIRSLRYRRLGPGILTVGPASDREPLIGASVPGLCCCSIFD